MFKKVSFVVIGILLCMIPGLLSASLGDCTDRHKKTISEGEGDENPKFYAVTPLEFKHFPSRASIGIDKDGDPMLYCSLMKDANNSLKDLDKVTAISFFGEFKGYGESTKPTTFDVIGFNPNGPNIFHLDMEFNETQMLTKYRIRGYGITKPEWKQVQ